MNNIVLREGVWFTQTNGAIYQVLSINDETGDYEAEGLSYDGIYYLRCEFGNVDDGEVLIGVRESTDEEIQHALSLQDTPKN